MRAGGDQHRSVAEVAIVQQYADGEYVVIGVRIERPVLMPFHRRAVLRRLHVELGAVQPQARAQQFLQDVEHSRGSHDLVEQRMHLVRRLDPAHPRALRGMARLEVIDIGVFEGFGRPRNQLRDYSAHLAERRGVQHLGHHDDAVAFVGLHIVLRNHTAHLLVALSCRYVSAVICLRQGKIVYS